MKRVSKYAFIHAKMHGLMAKSFLDERLRSLLRLASLADILNTLFPAQDSPVSDQDLVHVIQRRFEERTIQTLVRMLTFFPEPPALLVHVLREYEYRNLKTLIRGRFSAVKDVRLWDIGRYGEIPASAASDFPAVLRKTRFHGFEAKIAEEPLFRIEFDLDRQYYDELAGHVRALPAGERKLALPLLEYEIILQNIIWALRLRYYFHYSLEQTRELLFPLGFSRVRSQVEIMYDLPFDSPELWKSWKLGRMLVKTRDGRVDPESAEAHALLYLYRKTRRTFYDCPFTLSSVYAFFRIKQYEARMIQSAAEGVRMGLSSSELAGLMGVS